MARSAMLVAALLGVLVVPSAQAVTPRRSLAAVAGGGIPALVNPTADLAAQALDPG